VRSILLFLTIGLVLVARPALAETPSLESGTVIAAAERLRPGEFLWAPDVAPRGPVLLVVSVATQRAVVYRNGVPIGISTVSTGRPGYRTPTGVFTILQKHVEHYSSLYNNAPMPFMQRLTWGGVALHAGDLPGYPASHGCIRLPREFARLLYGVTHIGMTVVVTDRQALPSVAPAETLLGVGRGRRSTAGGMDWHPELAPSGPLSIVVSAADRRVVVLRNGVRIGSSPLAVTAPIERPSAFVLNQVDASGRSWLRIPLPGQAADDRPPALRGAITVPDDFRRALEAVLVPGTTVVVTADPLERGSTGQAVALTEEGEEASPPPPGR
jgi:hypothetical protein